MKIKGTHTECGREFLVSQILDSQGHCPWDGKPFNKDYTANLALALRQAELAGTAFEAALEQVAAMHPALVLDEDSLLGPVLSHLERLRAGAKQVRA